MARREDHPPPTSRPRGGAGVVFRLSCLTAPAQCMRWRCGAMIGFGPPIGTADRPCEGPCHSPREQPAGSRYLPRDRPPGGSIHDIADPRHHRPKAPQTSPDTRRAQSALHRPRRSTVVAPVRPTQIFRPIENSESGSAMLGEGAGGGRRQSIVGERGRLGQRHPAVRRKGAPTAAVAVATIDLRLPSQPVPQVARGSAEFLQRTPSS